MMETDSKHTAEKRQSWIRRLPWKKIINGLLFATCVVFVMRYFTAQSGELASYHWTINGGFLVLAMLALLGTYVCQAMVWRGILSGLSTNVSISSALFLHLIGSFAGFIPGRLWGPLSVAYVGASRGLAPVQIISATIYSVGLSLMAGAVLTLVGYLAGLKELDQVALWMSPILVGGCVLFFPSLVYDLVNWMLAKLKRPQVQLTMGTRTVALYLLAYIGVWCLYGISLTLLAAAVSDISLYALPQITIANVASCVAGYVAFFAPVGLGVREFVLSSVLSLFLPMSQAMGLSLLSRVWTILCQALALAGSYVLIRFADKKDGKARTYKIGTH